MDNGLRERIAETHAALRRRLLVELSGEDHWTGHLSSSALSTAVAVFALARVDRGRHQDLIRQGLVWLAANQNPDGGWGDATVSPSNLSTSLLCWSALSLADPHNVEARDAVARAELWLTARAGGLGGGTLADAVLRHYGNDRTFSAPILTMCALAGRLGDDEEAWPLVPQLPFELAYLPQALFRLLRLPVVSYAIPALIGIGLVRHRHLPSRVSPFSALRDALEDRVLTKLVSLQPSNGGFLEATPLTAFVTMSLAASGHSEHLAVQAATRFLIDSMRDDGSWPIDTDLATWVTTLSIKALAAGGPRWTEDVPSGTVDAIRHWLLKQQGQTRHPFTGAASGGWAWTDHPGGVPDADDTAGVLLALGHLGEDSPRVRSAAAKGVEWLLNLQNGDGGMPTFCRGWGKLPFDRSCPDLTAHALAAVCRWRDSLPARLARRADRALKAALSYLSGAQRRDGAWVPLWFGNAAAPEHENPTYGTAVVLNYLREARLATRLEPTVAQLLERGQQWLVGAQSSAGGWGGDRGVAPSIEETALAVSALYGSPFEEAWQNGASWLVEATDHGTGTTCAPIGLYFASLWYWERLYPLIFATAALGKVEPRPR